jgi:hypothetical protein
MATSKAAWAIPNAWDAMPIRPASNVSRVQTKTHEKNLKGGRAIFELTHGDFEAITNRPKQVDGRNAALFENK